MEGKKGEGRAVRRTWRKSRSPIRQALRQAQGRLSGDAGMTGVCSVGRADVSSVQFLAECVQFRGECVHFGGRCVQFSAGRLGWGWGCGGSGCCCRAGWRGCGGFCGIRGMGAADGGGGAVAGADPGVWELAVARGAGALAGLGAADGRGQSGDEGVVVLAVRPVWGGAAEGAEAVDSVPDYVVTSWDPKTALRASDWIRGVAWV